MAWTATTFKARYTEFDGTADSVVTAALAEATRRTAAGFGARFDDAVALLAAHLLSVSPGGRQARRESDKGPSTTYMTELKLLRREVFGGGWSVGQGSGGLLT